MNEQLNEALTHLVKTQCILDRVNISEIILESDLDRFELIREKLNDAENELQKLRESLDCSSM